MEPAAISIAAALGAFAFFGGIALLMWIDSKTKRHERELAHAERLKALEMGQPLPDVKVAREQTDRIRAFVLGMVGFVVPPSLIGAAVGGTALVFSHENTSIHLPLTCVIWGICGLISLVAVASTLSALQEFRPELKKPDENEDHDGEEEMTQRIKERPTLMK